MGRLMTKCPKTGEPVPTGVVIDQAAFEITTLSSVPLPDPCPRCGKFHEWSSEDAWVEES